MAVNRTFLVAAGGVVGCVARYWIAGWVQSLNGAEFPWGTLTVNVLGSFVIGLVMTLSLDRGVIDADVRILLTTGFCGGFTTMSTFSYETLALLRDGSNGAGSANVALTVASCVAAAWLGTLTGRAI